MGQIRQLSIQRLVFALNLSRSMAESRRMIEQGQVWVGCDEDGWTKITDPKELINESAIVKIGYGNWRCIPRLDDGGKFDQLPGVGRFTADVAQG